MYEMNVPLMKTSKEIRNRNIDKMIGGLCKNKSSSLTTRPLIHIPTCLKQNNFNKKNIFRGQNAYATAAVVRQLVTIRLPI